MLFLKKTIRLKIGFSTAITEYESKGRHLQRAERKRRSTRNSACSMSVHVCTYMYVFIHVYTHVLKDKSKIKMCSDYPPYSPFK